MQFYLRDVAASATRPVKELRGFERVALRPGRKKTVRFTLTPRDLGFLDRRMRLVVEPGEFRVTAGTSSVGGLEASFSVADGQRSMWAGGGTRCGLTEGDSPQRHKESIRR